MKQLLLGLVVLGASSAAFADEMPAVSGDIGAYVGGMHLSSGSTNSTPTSFGGDARINFVFNSRWNLQTDLFVDSVRQGSNGFTGYGGTAHVFWRDPAAYAIGGFLTVVGYDITGTSTTPTWVYGGPEFQYYMDNVTVGGQLFYGEIRAGSQKATQWGVRGEARYYFNDNMRLNGELAYSRVDVPGSSDVNIFTAATQFDYRFDNSPLTAYARYQFDDYSTTGGGGADAHKFVVGLRASFGSKSLAEEEDYGVAMSTYRFNLPGF